MLQISLVYILLHNSFKKLSFQYKPEENRDGLGVYHPERLVVSSNSARFIKPIGSIYQGPHLTFMLSDFFPSYWSLHSDRKDRDVYDEEYMSIWLEDSDWL